MYRESPYACLCQDAIQKLLTIELRAQLLELRARSSDAGSSWSQVTTDPVFGGLTGVSGHDNGLDPSLWVAVGHDGSDGLVVRSVDDGLTWTTPKYISEAPFNSVTWTGFRWVAVGSDGFESGIIYESLDGVIWDLVSLAGDVKPLLDVSTDGSGTVIAVGESGEIVRSTDGGETFVCLLYTSPSPRDRG